jgi:predicted ester cyclase
MTRAETVAFLERRFDAYHRHDAVALASDHAENGIVMSPIFTTIQGRAAIEASYRSLFTAFENWAMKGGEPIIDGDRVALVIHVTAIHASELFGLPGSGKRVEFTGVMMLTLENGLIAQERRFYDFTGLLMQIGVLKGKVAK